jgi:hypothetical protein
MPLKLIVFVFLVLSLMLRIALALASKFEVWNFEVESVDPKILEWLCILNPLLKSGDACYF